jgi:UDPglucose 6-dehydrogenase
VTDWQEFRNLNYSKIAQLMNSQIIIDGRNFLDPGILVEAGFYYIGIGRPEVGDRFVEKRLDRNLSRNQNPNSLQLA